MEAKVVTFSIKVNKKKNLILESFTNLSKNTEDILAVVIKL